MTCRFRWQLEPGRGRNEHQHENRDDNKIDRPAFTRKFSTSDFRNEAIGINNDDWDMPAFLRKEGNLNGTLHPGIRARQRQAFLLQQGDSTHLMQLHSGVKICL